MSLKPNNYSHIRHIVSESALFQSLPNEVLESMFKHFKSSTTWEIGSIVNPHRQVHEVYLILDGRVSIDYTDQVTGKNLTLSVLGMGDLFDIVSLMSQYANDTVVTALDELTVLNIPSNSLKYWMQDNPQFNTNCLSYMAMKISHLESKSASLATANSSTRLARLIFHHTDRQPSKNGIYSVQLIHDFTNEGLAKMIGSSRQVVNKHLQILRNNGVLCGYSKDLVVMNLAKLKSFI